MEIKQAGIAAMLCSVPSAANALALGMTKTRALIAAGHLETVTIGSRRLVKITSLKALASGGDGTCSPHR